MASYFQQIQEMMYYDPTFAKSEFTSRFLFAKNGKARRKFTRSQFEAIEKEFKYRQISLVSRTIIDNFLNMDNWVHYPTTPRMKDKIETWVSTIRAWKNGDMILAKALEEASQDGIVKEIQTYSYDHTVNFYLDMLMVYVQKSAEDISAREIERARQLAKEYDDYDAQEGSDPFADEEAFGAFGL